MAFSDEMIRAVVATGRYSDERAEQHLGDVLIQRRDVIGRTYLSAVNPIVSPSLDPDGRLTFRNAAVDAKIAERPKSYAAKWFTFDNATGATSEIGESESADSPMTAPRLPQTSFLKVELRAVGASIQAWERPISAYFKRQGSRWSLVGLERLPSGQ